MDTFLTIVEVVFQIIGIVLKTGFSIFVVLTILVLFTYLTGKI